MIDDVWIVTLLLVTIAESCSQAPGLSWKQPILLMKAVQSLLTAYSPLHYFPYAQTEKQRGYAASPWEEIILLDTITGLGVWHRTTGSGGPNIRLIVRQLGSSAGYTTERERSACREPPRPRRGRNLFKREIMSFHVRKSQRGDFAALLHDTAGRTGGFGSCVTYYKGHREQDSKTMRFQIHFT